MAVVREVEPPLGEDAAEQPTLEEVEARWQATRAEPVPPYDGRPLPGGLSPFYRR